MEQSSSTSLLISYGSVQDAVADRIRKMILSGQVKPGEWLRQDDLAGTFGVSTMPVREAMRQLQAEGLVIFHPRRGATVATITVSDYEEIYRIREELEVLACEWAAKKFERVPVEHLKQLLDDIQNAQAQNEEVHRRMLLVRDFFFSIFEASEKDHLLRILSGLWDLSQHYRRFFSSLSGLFPQRLENYRRVYQACEARDPQALVQAIRTLYAFGKATLIPRLREEEKRQTS